MKQLCIFHSIDGNTHCDDGFGAALAVKMALGDDVEFHPGVYQRDPPDVAGRDVIIVDFSYKPDVMRKIMLDCRSLVLLDHHKSASIDMRALCEEEDIGTRIFSDPGLNWCSHHNDTHGWSIDFDMDHSGAVMAWQYFHDAPVPRFFQHLQDRDLWKFELPGTREISMALRSVPQTFEIWEQFATAKEGRPGNSIDRLKSDGIAITRYYDRLVDQFCEQAWVEVIPSTRGRRPDEHGFAMPVVNVPLNFASDVANKLAEVARCAACFAVSPAGVSFSLRSRADHKDMDPVDVSEIAKQFGGGGHQHAAGFRISHEEFRAWGWMK